MQQHMVAPQANVDDKARLPALFGSFLDFIVKKSRDQLQVESIVFLCSKFHTLSSSAAILKIG